MTVFHYTDYRKFLRDYYEDRKAKDRTFTVRFIAEKVGFRSASFFSQLMNGRSNMSDDFLGKFSQFLALDKKESDYFKTLVHYNQAKNHSQKKKIFEKLISFKQSRLRTIDASLYEFYDKWYYNAIRELLYIRPFAGDYHALSKMLNPPISPSEAERTVLLLEKWGLVIKDEKGRFVRSNEQSMTTGMEAQSFYINNYQCAVMDLAKEALDRFPRDKRSLSTLTMSLSAEGFRKIDEEIHLFRQHLLSIAEEDTREDAVYQLNLQFFPMTNTLSRDGQ